MRDIDSGYDSPIAKGDFFQNLNYRGKISADLYKNHIDLNYDSLVGWLNKIGEKNNA
jgi:hypothetical protein